MSFVDTFVLLCNKKGVSPNKACSDLGFSNSTYSYWKKSNSTPHGSSLFKIAEYFEVTVAYLTGKELSEETSDRIVRLVIEWLEDNGYEYEEHDNSEISITKDGNTEWQAEADFIKTCERIYETSKDGFELAMREWERRTFTYQHTTNRSNNHYQNSISESPNATLTINGDGLSKQEKELIELYRNFSIKDQMKLLSLAFELNSLK